MTFESSINLGNLLTIMSFLVGGIYFMFSVRTTTQILDTKFTMVEAQIEDFKVEMKKLNEILVRMATSDARVGNIEQRQLAQGKRLDEAVVRLNQWVDKRD